MSSDLSIYFFPLMIGIFLGVMGGVGTILTLPILVYVSGFSAVISTTYSLFILGTTSLINMIYYYRRNLVNYRDILYFLAPSFITAFLVRVFIFHQIPDILLQINQLILTKNKALMLVFAILMLVAAISIISTKDVNDKQENVFIDTRKIILIGILTGIVTSLSGLGGGFIIIPTLVFLLRLPMKIAIGTSLFIITCNSFISFTGDLINNIIIDWNFLLPFSAVAILGIFIGFYLSNYVSGTRLRVIFGYMMVCITFFILIKELIVR
jgi:uncharacterized membrane protein YfcA